MEYPSQLIIDASGMYRKREDGSREYICTTFLEINGKTIYDFDQETGVLRVSKPLIDLENLKIDMKETPKEGKYLVLHNPLIGIPVRFKGVRSIESITA